MKPEEVFTVTEPIRQAFPAEKAKAWHYKIHPYFTKQPSNVVGEYVRHFCPKGGLVVDPFCGSGVTAIEALVNRRRALCLDLDPFAAFITRMTCLSPVDLAAFWDAYHKVEIEMKPVMDFVRKSKPGELDNYELKEWYPKGVKLPSNADRGYVEDLFGRAQLITLAHLRAAIIKIADIQTRELLLFAFSGILARASITYGIDPKHEGGGDSGIFKVYRYWVPPTPDYRDVWELFSIRARLVAKAKEKGNKLFGDFVKEGNTFSVYRDSAENLLKYVGRNTVDYIYTDPPYGAHIAYLDLSTMWDSWLGFKVTNEMRLQEAIEGGEQKFDEKHYLDVLQKSFEQMFYALKDNAWLSLVFHHKETNLWYSIRDMLRYTGFTYSNTVAQPLSKQTFHKVKNPLRVLGESLIINFQKSATRRIAEPMPLSMASVIRNAAEIAIARGGGATTEEVLREVVPQLFDANLFIDAASKNMNDILAMLEQDFEQGDDKLWHLKKGRQLGSYIPEKDRIRYFVVSYLRTVSKANFDAIITTVLPKLINGHQPRREDIADVLNEVAISYDKENWQLRDPRTLGVQAVFELPTIEAGKPMPVPADLSVHSQQIYRLAVLCLKAGLAPYIGKKERGDQALAQLKPLSRLDIQATADQLKGIEQIDITWATASGSPVWAFEVEESTTILSALERFVDLLAVAPDLGKAKQLTIVASKARRRKLHQELTSSSYVGHPQYMENKITYLFYDDLEKAYTRLSSRGEINLKDLAQYCHPAQEIDK